RQPRVNSTRAARLAGCAGGERPRRRAVMGGASLDHLVGACEQRWGQVEADRLGRVNVNYQFELDRLLDRNIRWFSATQNLVDMICTAPVEIGDVRSVGHQTSRIDILPLTEHRWQPPVPGKLDDVHPIGVCEWISADNKRLGTILEAQISRCDIFGAPD